MADALIQFNMYFNVHFNTFSLCVVIWFELKVYPKIELYSYMFTNMVNIVKIQYAVMSQT